VVLPGARIDGDSWEEEWRSDGRVYLHDGTGNVVEGSELCEAEVEQMSREMLLADVLELAALKLPSGEAGTEARPRDVLNEIEQWVAVSETTSLLRGNGKVDVVALLVSY
jgi:hypothetical protein